jgi:hypothetical protein
MEPPKTKEHCKHTTNLVATQPCYHFSPNPFYCQINSCPEFYLDRQVSYNENSRKLQAMQHAMISQNMRTSAGI